ncbi:MAG: NYN domain-containing protein [Trebonia sp.]
MLTDGAMAVHGTRRRESVSWDYAGLLQLFGSLAMERTRLPLLRCYWYEATVEGRRSADHDTLADLPGVKLRVTKMRPGHREGVEGEIHRDLTTLARNKAVSDVMVVSAEEDLAQVITDVQDLGLRVTLLHIATDGNWTISRALRQECDDIVEVSAAHLRPYVELISGAEPPRPDESDGKSLALRPAMNGNGANGNGAAPAGRIAAYAQPYGRPGAGQQPPAPSVPPAPAADRAARQVPIAIDAAQGDRGQPDRVDGVAQPDYAPVADFGASVDYSASVDYGAPAEYAPAGDQGAQVDFGSAPDYGATVDYGPAPVALTPPADELSGERDRTGPRPRPGADPSAYSPGVVREQQYQRENMLREAPAVDAGDRLQPVPIAVPSNGSAQVRRLPTRAAVPGGPNQGQPAPGLPPVPPEAGIGQQAGGQQPAGQQLGGQPTGGQPVVPMDYPGARGAPLGGPRQVIPGPGAPGGPGPLGPPAIQQAPQGPPAPQGSPVPPVPQVPGGQQVQGGQQEIGAPSGPIGLAGQGGYSGGPPGVSLGDAVQSAHEEGQAFGDSVARDAPALWLEAVLARKPRMPSDLEARLLQGSALPIDFLLHDEVRHALRRGFWDALERARR